MIFSLKRTLPIVLAITTFISCGKDNTASQPEPELLQWYVDGDTDNFGNPDTTLGLKSITKPDGYVIDNTDCDDSKAAINPLAEEDDYDGVDSNCDGVNEQIITTYSITTTSDETGVEKLLEQGVQDDNGDIVLSGISIGSDADILLEKYNENGNLLWKKDFVGSNQDLMSDLITTADKAYVFCARSSSTDGDYSNNNGGFDGWVTKLTRDGEIIWSKAIGGAGSDRAFSVIETVDSGYLITGTTTSTGGDFTEFNNFGNTNSFFLKLDQLGN